MSHSFNADDSVPNYLVVVMFTVLVVSSAGHLMRLQPAVIRALFESDFFGLKSTTMRVYMGFLPSLYIFDILAWSMTKV